MKLFINNTLVFLILLFFSCGDGQLSNPHDPHSNASPDKPTELIATALTDTKIQLQWKDNGVESYFKIRRKKNLDKEFNEIGSVPENITTFIDTTAKTGNIYFYRVIAFTANGKEVFEETSINHIFPSPTELTLIAISPTTIKLNWKNNAFFPVSFKMERTTASDYSLKDTTSDVFYTDNNVNLGNLYRYRVTAFTQLNESNGIEDSILHTLETPTNFSANVKSLNEVYLNWIDNSLFEKKYVVERKENGTTYSTLVSLPINTSSYIDNEVQDGIIYTYKVKCMYETFSSNYSNEDSALILFNPPSNLSINSLSESSLILYWKDESNVEKKYEIERDENNSGFLKVGEVSADSISFLDQYLNRNNTYKYRVTTVIDEYNRKTSDEIKIKCELGWQRRSGWGWDFYDIFFLNKNDGWAVGRRGLCFKTIDGGENWIEYNLNTNSILYNVLFLTNQIGWISGGEGSLYLTSNGGISWSLRTIPHTDISDILFIDIEIGYIAGTAGILKTINGGYNWEIKVDTSRCTSISFISSTTGWIADVNGNIWKTIDSGETWIGYQINKDYRFDKIFFVNENKGWGICHTNYYKYILCTDNGGISWFEQLKESYQLPREFDDIFFIDEYVGWIVSEYSRMILNTNNGGISWIYNNLDYYGPRSIFFINKEQGWGVGYGIWEYKPIWIPIN